MAFGEKLQEVRKQSGMTQETFAEQLHVSRQAVSRWESGRGYPEIEKILYICHRYHTTLDALFADELPPVEAEEAEVEQPIAGKPLKRSFVDFLSNLSPYDKLIGGTLIFIVLLSLMALAHSMKGGSGGNMTFVWIPPRGGDSRAGLHLVRGGRGGRAALAGARRGALAADRRLSGGLHRGADRNAPAGAQNAG